MSKRRWFEERLLWYTNLDGLRLEMTVGVVERGGFSKESFGVYYRGVEMRLLQPTSGQTFFSDELLMCAEIAKSFLY